MQPKTCPLRAWTNAKALDGFARFSHTQCRRTDSNQAEKLSPLGSSPPPDPRLHKSKPAGKKKGRTMNPLFELKKTAPLLLITLTLLCFGLLPKVLAVVPPPDGGYPGFTTAEGQNALQNLTTGVGNTAAGWHSLFTNSVGNLNTAIGAGTLLFNTGDNNTATGALALLSNTTGIANTAKELSRCRTMI